MRNEPSMIFDYIDATFASEDALLRTVREAGEASRPGMQVHAHEAKLLQVFLQLIQAKRVIEVGCFMGYSAIWMARALPEDGQLITCERNASYAEQARRHFETSEVKERIQLVEGDAMAHLPDIAAEAPVDAIFIDGEKRRYPDYLQAVLPHLRKGGLVMADNSLLWGGVADAEKEDARVSAEAKQAMKDFNAQLADETRFTSVLIPTTEGLTVAIKR